MKTVFTVVILMACLGGGAAGAAEELKSAALERFDKNGDGTLDVKEMPPQLARRVQQADRDGDGKLNASELAPFEERLARMGGAAKQGGGGGSTRRQGEINTPPAQGERYEDKLKVGDKAPDFALPVSDGSGEITLSEFGEGKPVVLIFGSLTCPPFRSRMLQFDPIFQKYKETAAFLMVYTREAHPESTIYVKEEDGGEALKTILQTDEMKQRMEHASFCGPTLKFTFPTVVDKVDNKVNEAYAGWPSRFVVVGVDGKVAYDGGPGPKGFQPAELESWLAMQAK